MADPITMPALSCPFGQQLHPDATQVEEQVNRWLQQTGLVTDPARLARYQATHHGRFAALVYPQAQDARLLLAAKWLSWMNIFDDHHLDESESGADPATLGRVLIPFLDVLSPPHTPRTGPRTAAAPLVEILRALVAETRSVASHVQFRRFATDLTVAMHAALLETSWAASETVPKLDEYRITRQFSGAVFACFRLIDIVAGYDLPPAHAEDSALRDLAGAAVNVITWANDVFSYTKEANRSRFDVNLPTVLRHHHGCTVQQALDESARMHDEEVDYYLHHEQLLLEQAPPTLRRYLEGLRAWMQGNYRWSLASARFELTPQQIGSITTAGPARTPQTPHVPHPTTQR
jgi:hypothetical protein